MKKKNKKQMQERIFINKRGLLANYACVKTEKTWPPFPFSAQCFKKRSQTTLSDTIMSLPG